MYTLKGEISLYIVDDIENIISNRWLDTYYL